MTIAFMIKNEINHMISEIIDKELNNNIITKIQYKNKAIAGGLIMEAFFTLSHRLCTIAESTQYLLNVK